MTEPRHDKHSTEFGLWLRDQQEIDSRLGFVATNIDYVWKNWKTGKWYLIEEKRFMSEPKEWQHNIFKMIDRLSKEDENYCGFFIIQFEKTSPEDGKIFVNKKEFSVEELIQFLKFERETK